MMQRKYLFILLSLLAVGIVVALIVGAADNWAVLTPKGLIAQKERELIIIATLLMLVVVIPVFVLTAVIVWKYRAGNLKAKYTPDWEGNKTLEAIWWGFPCAIILVLAVLTWQSSHSLDPFKPIEAATKPLNVQVVALQWRWLFIYPEQNIATVNFLEIPEDTPVNFILTSDAPMNSFWIPQLGGQVYAMSGMSTKLHLMANEPGSYTGLSSNLSGAGFANMQFTTQAVTQTSFDEWVAKTHALPDQLTLNDYNYLAIPSEDKQVIYYSGVEKDLYNHVVMKYMAPMSEPYHHHEK
jgi:cytochrome o ubiquinol oxidase subunit 2